MDLSFGLIGSGRVLAKVFADGTLNEMFFPSVGFYRHIIQSQFGFAEEGGEHRWLGDKRLDRRQRYLENTNVLVTSVWIDGLLIEVTDFVHPEYPVLIRKAELRNTRAAPVNVRLSHMEAASLEENRDHFGHNLAYYDTRRRCLIRFRGHPFDNAMEGHSVLLIAADPVQNSFQCGVSYERQGDQIDAYLDIADGELCNNAYSSGGDRGATTGLLWNVPLAPGESRALTVFLCGELTLEAAERPLEAVRAIPVERLLAETVSYWREWLSPAAAWSEQIDDPTLRGLYRRSLLVNKLMQDRAYGSIIAAPSIDPDYRYCWVRDGAFVAWSFDVAGYHEEAANFYRWCARTQMADGLWHQNYYTDGRRHWPGIQIDQVGTAIWGMHQHYRLTRDRRFLSEMWPTLRVGAEYLVAHIDATRGLIYSEQDLWEEAPGYLTYTNAACQAGLYAAAAAAEEAGVPSTGDVFRQAADRLRVQMRRRLVQNGVFVGDEEPCRPSRGRTDYLVDISLVGLVAPFAVEDPLAPVMTRTVERIESACDFPIKGVGRYAGDLFMGGNPWSLAALWLAHYYAAAGRAPEARHHLDWCVRYASPHGFLAEQQDKRTGAPVSANPLAWSHAWLITLIHTLEEKGL